MAALSQFENGAPGTAADFKDSKLDARHVHLEQALARIRSVIPGLRVDALIYPWLAKETISGVRSPHHQNLQAFMQKKLKSCRMLFSDTT
jgi:hypothetical protein